MIELGKRLSLCFAIAIALSPKRTLGFMTGLSDSTVSTPRHFQCTVEQRGDQDFCVFRDLHLQNNEAEVTFGFPGSTAPTHVAFENCHISALPGEFWNTFGGKLRVLEAESCGLTSITVTNALEVLHVRNNSISSLTVQQNCNLTELDISGNELGNFQNLSTCSKLKLDVTSALSSLADPGSPTVYIMMQNQLHFWDVTESSQHIIDLPSNTMYKADRKPRTFVQFCALKILKDNQNAMGQRGYEQLGFLIHITLKQHDFKCYNFTQMFNVSHQLGINMPEDRAEICQPNDTELFCCIQKPTVKPTQRASTPATVPTTTSASNSHETVPSFKVDHNSSTVWIALPIAAAVICAVLVGYLLIRKIHDKRRSQENNQEQEMNAMASGTSDDQM